MCRYAMVLYKPHYACFHCRKTFKRRLLWDINRDDKSPEIEAKCPQCSGLMANMGKDFEAPRKDDVRKWDHIKTLYAVGITFHSCGCTGPGYIPASGEALTSWFTELLKEYNDQLSFWRSRVEPTSQKEVDRDKSKHWDYISKVPFGKRSKKAIIDNETAINYWIGRIKEVNSRLETLNRI